MNESAEVPSVLRESAVAVFVNPVAGGGRDRACLAQIRKLFETHQVRAQFIPTNSSAELEKSARVAISQGCRALIAMGGDGTFQALANAVFGADVLLGVLPCGGGNDFAAALGLPENPLKAADALLRGQPRFVDLARVRTVEGRTRLYAGGGGVGLDAEAMQYASGVYRWFPGRLRYLASALRALVGHKALEVRIDFPGSGLDPYEGKGLLVAALNSPSYGAGVRLAPGAAMDDGLLDVVMIEYLGKIGALALLPRLIGSGEVRTTRLKRWKAQRIRLTTNRPSSFHGDGEIIGTAPVEIEVVPRAIQVLAPQKD